VLKVVAATSAALLFGLRGQLVGDGQRRHEQVHVDADQPCGRPSAKAPTSPPWAT